MFRFPIALLLGLLLYSSIGQAQAPQVPPEPRQVEAVQRQVSGIFYALGLRAGKEAPWVIVEIGPAGPLWNIHGWLVVDTPEQMLIFQDHGAFVVLRRPRAGEARPRHDDQNYLNTKKPLGQEPEIAWSVRAGNHEQACKRLLSMGLPKLNEFGNYDYNTEAQLEHCLVGGCLHGFQAMRQGQAGLSQKLFALAFKAERILTRPQPGDKPEELDQQILNKVARAMGGSAEGYANGGLPRPGLLRLWEYIARLPMNKGTKNARGLVDGYKSLIAEDQNWKEPSSGKLATMSVQEKIDYWMYRLRDLDNSMYEDMALVSLGSRTPRYILAGFLIPPSVPVKPNPAKELAKLGTAALPAVIAHLDDARPTRTGPLLRYGDCCQQIFEGITQHTLFPKKGYETYPVQAGEAGKCKEQAEKWWAEFQRQGEKGMLAHEVAQGTSESIYQAQMLVEKYPDAAFDPIVKGIRASKQDDVRLALVRQISQQKNPAVTMVLRKELRGPWFGARVAAARELMKRGDPAGCAGLIAEWQQKKWKDTWLGEYPAKDLIDAMLASGDLSTTQALTSSFAHQPVWVRAQTIEIIEQWLGLNRDVRGQPLTRGVRSVVEDMLGEALDDQETYSSSRGGGITNLYEVKNPSIADLAAEALVMFWGQPYNAFFLGQPLMFNLYQPAEARQVQRQRVKRAWLKNRERAASRSSSR